MPYSDNSEVSNHRGEFHGRWANSALRPKIFGFIDAHAGIPVIVLAFDLDNALLFQWVLITCLGLIILDYLGLSPRACVLCLRRGWGKLWVGQYRTDQKPFCLALKRFRNH